MNMISLVEAASVDKSLYINADEQKYTGFLVLYFIIYQISYINPTL